MEISSDQELTLCILWRDCVMWSILHGFPQSPSFSHMELHYAWGFNRQTWNSEQSLHWRASNTASHFIFLTNSILLPLRSDVCFLLCSTSVSLTFCCIWSILSSDSLSSQRAPSLCLSHCLRGLCLEELEWSSHGQQYLALCFRLSLKKKKNWKEKWTHTFKTLLTRCTTSCCLNWRVFVCLHELWRLTLCHKHPNPTITIWSSDWSQLNCAAWKVDCSVQSDIIYNT